ncbi:Zn-binding domain-containing protein [Candidatus Thiodictyon syntrophicum]|jgi:hypothetical protein|uniref:MrfA-like Zn-binding domain-containing protein n=1 Tax=Candidatus Thiodictyon syntrophicum TaxID=1166950 RepID=A0A2K8U735_9GAMM|nr:Zn-binding domain-containing protein [Candidatus Thiodictyon syntrophicum]AUB81229.1 hypothetical protein THSYN_09875 [Candidatus Thiodictyon syntrophicum]
MKVLDLLLLLLQLASDYVFWIAWFLLGATQGIAGIVDRLAQGRERNRDTGPLWASVVLWTSGCWLVLLPLCYLADWLPVGFWPLGWPRFFDRTGFGNAAGAGDIKLFLLALAIPFGVFAFLVAWGWWRGGPGAPARDAEARWLAGSIGSSIDGAGERWSRLWVLLLAFPLWAVLAWTSGALGGGPQGYPAALWASLGTVMIALVMVALSGPQRTALRPETASEPPPAPPPQPLDWPAALRRRGVDLETLIRLPASPPWPAPRGAGVGELARRLERAGLGGGAPQLIEALAALLNPVPGDGLARVVYAPDLCGQAEGIALGALLLDERLHVTTLVVCADGADVLAAALEEAMRALGRPNAVAVVTSRLEQLRQTSLWIVDANALSDLLLPMLRDPATLRRIGMIAWWQVHEYTGVLGANMWAVSRRLHRLVDARGREDVRVLAFVRSAFQGDDQASRFVKRLLPTRFGANAEVLVPRSFAHPVQLHRLTSHQRFFGDLASAARLRERVRFPVLVATLVSVEEGWPTAVTVPPTVSEPEVREVREVLAADGAGRLVPSGERALAWLAEIGDRDLLALLEMVCCGGLRVGGSGPFHVGLQRSANPYADFLLTQLGDTGSGRVGFDAARRLVGAEAHPAIVERHLLLALNEMPDTGQGLLNTFLWREDVVERTLDDLVAKERVRRRAVRFLDARDRLQVEVEYQTNRIPTDEARPLDTIGTNLIEVREATDSGPDRGVRLRIDPERLTILAYPLRAFMYRGQRYRVREWQNLDKIIDLGWLECEKDDRFALTWRIRKPLLREIEATGRAVSFGRGQTDKGSLERVAVAATYLEVIHGVRRVVPNLTTGTGSVDDITWYRMPISQRFRTRALVLRLPDAARLGLISLAQVLRHMLPVHIGAEADALDAVPVLGETIGSTKVSGIAIVDLFPGGIGLIEALEDDNALLLNLLARARGWLAACPCASDDGCERCTRSPAALADNPDELPRRRDALELIEQYV